MRDAMDVARYLVRVGYDPNLPGDSVLTCPLRLQKLLYYCQGWSLGLLGRQLFRQPLEAWVDGPVVREVYELFAGSSSGILPDEIGAPIETFSDVEIALIQMVWRKYAHLLPRELVNKTHTEPPWREARLDLPATTLSNTPLCLNTMKEFFANEAQRLAIPKPGFAAISAADTWKAEELYERSGRTSIPATDVFAELLSECHS